MPVKKIGFLSFGHWTPSPHSQTRSASDALLQSIEAGRRCPRARCGPAVLPRASLSTASLGSPFPLLAAVGAKDQAHRASARPSSTCATRIRCTWPRTRARPSIIAGGRLQLGISRGSPEQVIDGWRHFGYAPPEGQSDADMGRGHAEVFLEVLKGEGFARPNPRPMFPNPPGLCVEPYSEGLRERICGERPPTPRQSGRQNLV